ncbi:MAG: VanZ family protein [Clostridia bacterium]|nr:VanZ family protein [Clostridia bacterium]
MTKKNSIKNHADLFALIPVILVFIMIFVFSAQPAEESSQISDSIVDSVIDTVEKVVETVTEETQDPETLHHTLSFIVRKTAHATEFGMLGFTLAGYAAAQRSVSGISRRRDYPLCVAVGAVCGILDECHQFFSEGRAPRAADALIDTSGCIIGVCLMFLVTVIVRKLKNR